ncbi:hypothetical protein HJD18_03315 [Thermoleophilia bacterium SCSIO 60948]|nr:hypothetical protein HJD18_03315 [Thermoleophilia bacterium SCSIO 60948]
MSQRVRRVCLGDWSRLVRDPIDVLRLSYVVGAVVFLAIGNLEAIRVAMGAVIVYVARAANLPRPIDIAVCLGVGLEIWGQTLNLYDNIAYYDKFVHFALPLLISPLAYITLSRLKVVPDLKAEAARHHYLGIWLITFSVVAAFGGTLWEVFEYVSDAYIGSNLTFGYVDSISDMACTAAGSALGGLWLVLWAERRWGTERRPMEARSREREPERGPLGAGQA